MSVVYLGLGSNLGDRKTHLEKALQALNQIPQIQPLLVSSVFETPALLPQKSPPDWNKAFWNLAVQVETGHSPLGFLALLQKIEEDLGRTRESRWAPRTIDIDILLWEGLQLSDSKLTLPHPGITERAFVLDPMAEIAPHLRLSPSHRTMLELSRAHPQHGPRLMGILNLTPDSFSDGGRNLRLDQSLETLSHWEKDGPLSYLDLGAESTRPGASVVSDEEEWERLYPLLFLLKARYRGQFLRPKISLDTRKPQIAARALEDGIDLINDVGGLSDPKMLELLQSSSCQIVLMHSLSVPADPKLLLSEEETASDQVERWFSSRLEKLDKAGIKRNRVLLDPGIGFGKSAVQSLELLKNIKKFQSFACPLLVGHSRKSFLESSPAGSKTEACHRDPETLGASLALVSQGVDVLRVHDPILHRKALLAWSSIR